MPNVPNKRDRISTVVGSFNSTVEIIANFDSSIAVGNNLLAIRKKYGMTQNEVAEASGLSNRTYADIERGSVKMRVDTIIHICNALHITPDEILTIRTNEITETQEELFSRLNACSPKDKKTALKLLSVYLKSLE